MKSCTLIGSCETPWWWCPKLNVGRGWRQRLIHGSYKEGCQEEIAAAEYPELFLFPSGSGYEHFLFPGGEEERVQGLSGGVQEEIIEGQDDVEVTAGNDEGSKDSDSLLGMQD